ncbi:MAG: acetyl-CoA carboxylase carboxyl transferase subunit alpha, partial [Alphaproteobacteria bacterium]
LKLTAQDLADLGVIDAIVAEPLGGAHRERDQAIQSVGKEIDKQLAELAALPGDALRSARREKFLKMGTNGLA